MFFGDDKLGPTAPFSTTILSEKNEFQEKKQKQHQQKPSVPIVSQVTSYQKNQLPYYVARLNENGILSNAQEKQQFIIQVGSEVRFQLDYGTKISQNAVLLVNKPKVLNKDTVEYTITQPMSSSNSPSTNKFSGSALDTEYLEKIEPCKEVNDYVMEFRIKFSQSGSFFIQVAYENELRSGQQEFTQPQYINVFPIMNAGGQDIRCKEISLITVMSRCLGKIDRWPQVLQNVRELGYNAVHFTPFAKYGESYSHYSLADQTTVDDFFFEKEELSLTPKQRISRLKTTFDDLRQQGLLTLVDIVLNHTAHNSEWIIDHPEATYNTDDCPHLWSAWELDKGLRDFSREYAKRKIPECPSAPYISNEGDLQSVMKAIRKRVIDGLRIHEFFMSEVPVIIKKQLQPFIGDQIDNNEIEKYKKKFEEKGWFSRSHYELLRDRLTEGYGSGPQRFNVTLKMPDAAYYFLLVNQRNRQLTVQEVEKLLCQINDEWFKKIQGFMNEAYGAIEGNIRYFKTELKKSLINDQNYIVDPYFTELPNAKKSKVAHNGWIGGHNCMEDFGYVGWNYLRRTVNIWGDCIKLRYGSCPADSPFLWQFMTTHVQEMAEIADGFRLDNTHSTPIHVCQYLLQAARTKNPNLFVMAELFTDSATLDQMFCQRLNLNALVREAQNRYDTNSLGAYFHSLTCSESVIGQVDETFKDLNGNQYKILMSRKPEDMIYDCTHDNPTVLEKFQTGRMALPHIGLLSLADISIASTWGQDLLVPKQIHCVTEKRTYPIFNQESFINKSPIIYPYKQDKIFSEEQKQQFYKKQEKDEVQQQQKPAPTSFDFTFTLENGTASKVAVAGEFNSWKPDVFLNKDGKNWSKTITLPLNSGKREYQYKFVLDGSNWIVNNQQPTAKDASGNVNNVLLVHSNSTSSQISQTSSFQGIPLNPMINSGTSSSKEMIYEDMRYARMVLNRVHEQCTRLNAEIFLHQQTDDVLVVTRQLDMDLYEDFDSYVSISRFCFYNKGGAYNYQTSVELPGFMSSVEFAGYLEIPDSVYNDDILKNPTHIYGPRGCKLYSYTQLEGKFCTREKINEHKEKLNFHFMPPSFTCVIKVKSRTHIKQAVQRINCIEADPRMDVLYKGAPHSALNHVLFRCEAEERDISKNTRGPYGFKEYGQLSYAGITSIMNMFVKVKMSKDMGMEICENIRQGDWLIDYTSSRIRDYSNQEPSIGLQTLASVLEDYFNLVKQLPNNLKPKYAAKVVQTVYERTVKEVMSYRCNGDFIQNSPDSFMQKLALSIFQIWGRIPTAYFKEHKDTLCAGLTHFSTGYMRCWGRDTFIALSGLLIVSGLEDAARETILYFAKVQRHGLLPNLHDGGNSTRFNSRDAPWFFLQAIKDYVILSKEGLSFFDQKFELNFKDDDQIKHKQKTQGRVLTILELIIEICQRHCQGIEFREWNAGTQIDAHMKDNGFNVKIHCDFEKTGFCYGGNKDNCGTWMDKMGSSDATKNRGVPATPRDGAPIELVAMQYSILTWLSQMHKKGQISQDGFQVNRFGKQVKVTFQEWSDKIEQNFEKFFWIPVDRNQDSSYDINAKLVNRRGIYKDVHGSADQYTDYQLRSNICVAMSYAPQLFDRTHAQICLKNVAEILMEKGCMGMKTLDPKDRNYNGDYINSDLTCGWNYHQGPEWVWPVGFFLKAQLIFKDYKSFDEAHHDTFQWLIPHKNHILTNRWQGLPELTNSHGKHCPDSCVTQAWSMSGIIDALRDLYSLKNE